MFVELNRLTDFARFDVKLAALIPLNGETIFIQKQQQNNSSDDCRVKCVNSSVARNWFNEWNSYPPVDAWEASFEKTESFFLSVITLMLLIPLDIVFQVRKWTKKLQFHGLNLVTYTHDWGAA